MPKAKKRMPTSLRDIKGAIAVHETPNTAELRRKFQPYAIKLGLLVYSWNRLQEELSVIFWRVMGNDNGAIPLSAWYSTKNDRTQREMLRAAAANALRKSTKIWEELEWLLNRTNDLADKRNDCIHAPLQLVSQDGMTWLMPSALSLSPRARKLARKHLDDEFRYCWKCADVLADYAIRIAFSLGNPKIALPDRPRLPHNGQAQIRTAKRRRKRAK